LALLRPYDERGDEEADRGDCDAHRATDRGGRFCPGPSTRGEPRSTSRPRSRSWHAARAPRSNRDDFRHCAGGKTPGETGRCATVPSSP
jgi:hypothetical protein